MFPNMALWLKLLLSVAAAFVISFLMTPPVKRFAEKVGAIDVPKDDRRMHTEPVPRMGGLAIFLGFVLSALIFADVNEPVLGMLIGAVIIVVMGAVDDIVTLNAWVKLAAQVIAAVVAMRSGILFDVITNPFTSESVSLGAFSIPLTLLWLVGCTNAVNLIDGLDGLAVGISAISSVTMMVVALFVAEANIPLLLAALVGACIGFMPYNLNPARIFMGDVGSQFLGFVLATVSVMGLFKLHAAIALLVPIMAMAVPLADTVSSFFRRILHGQSPFHADKGHFHHRLLGMGLSQKQAVAVLYGISGVFGLLAVFLAGDKPIVRIICGVMAFIVVLGVWLSVFFRNPNLHLKDKTAPETDKPEK